MHKQFKPRNKHLNDILMSKRGGEHEPKEGKHTKRARNKNAFRELLRDM